MDQKIYKKGRKEARPWCVSGLLNASTWNILLKEVYQGTAAALRVYLDSRKLEMWKPQTAEQWKQEWLIFCFHNGNIKFDHQKNTNKR